jgi:hypothetical protein
VIDTRQKLSTELRRILAIQNGALAENNGNNHQEGFANQAL